MASGIGRTARLPPALVAPMVDEVKMSHPLSPAPRRAATSRRAFGNHPMAWAIAVALGATSVPVSAQQAFSPAWFADKGAAQGAAAQSGRMPNGMPVNFGQPTQQQDAARQKLQQSIDNLGSAAQAIALQQRMQEQARLQQRAAGYVVADGLAEGGLKVDVNPLTRGWLNAKEAIQSRGTDGRVLVGIEQTADKAILNWETFNVGANTTLSFNQNADWAVLNRVNDPNALPSQILGQIKAPGSVFVANRNGVMFGNNSQVNVRNLVAAAARISDGQFRDGGLYGADATTATLTDALGDVRVEQGARIITHDPSSATRTGGYVLLAGHSVVNAGTIETRKGQAQLAAGDAFVIRRGVGTAQNTASTTRGNEVAPVIAADSTAGHVINTGLIRAREGDITLAGRTVEQGGVAVATTTIAQRGTVHLLNSISDGLGSVTLAEGSTTAVLVEDDGKTTALDTQRDALIAESTTQDALRATSNVGRFDNLSRMQDRRDQSRVEIVSGGDVDIQGDSLTVATGGQIIVDAARRTALADGARVDVSGAVGVQVAMESNNVKINVQGNELRDSPDNRDTGKLNNLNNNAAWIDRRELIHVAAGTGGYASDRWYAAGGLLEVGGYLGNQGHSIGEWAAQGGTLLLGGQEVVTRSGSRINLSGGTLDVASGKIHQTWLRGNDGNLYRLDDAPANVVFEGLYQGYALDHARWGVSESFRNPVIASETRVENGYTVGRDAGRLIVSAPTAVLDGDIDTAVFDGVRQQRAPDMALDGYAQAQTAVARGAQLWLGAYDQGGRSNVFASRVEITAGRAAGVAPTLGEAVDASRVGTVLLDADRLSAQRWGRIDLATAGTIRLDDRLALADGGQLVLTASDVALDGTVSIAGGQLLAGTIFQQGNSALALLTDGRGSVQIGQEALIDLRGNWFNAALANEAQQGQAWIHGGRLSVESSHDVHVAQGSRILVDAGASVNLRGSAKGGKGGNVGLVANSARVATDGSGRLQLDGELSGRGVSGSGALQLASGGKIQIGGTAGAPGASDAAGSVDALVLAPTLLQTGFARYDVNGHQGVDVADDTRVDVMAPGLRFKGDLLGAATREDALEAWTAPLYAVDPIDGQVTQRGGASLTLRSERLTAGGDVRIGHGADVRVDSGESITLLAGGNIAVDGRLQAHGGNILLDDVRDPGLLFNGQGSSLVYRIGRDAVLDVSGDAHVAEDRGGRLRGVVKAGGTIGIGGELDWETSDGIRNRPLDGYVVIEEGARLDASGTAAQMDVDGQGRRNVATDGGSIVLRSAHGLYLDGDMRAEAGGAGAQGGTLGIAFGGAVYAGADVDPAVLAARTLTLTQHSADVARLGDGPLEVGHAWLSAEQIAAGGFDHLALFADVRAKDSVDLVLGQSLRVHGADAGGRSLGMHEASTAGTGLRLAAPYVRLAQGRWLQLNDNGQVRPATPGAAEADAHALDVQAELVDIRDIVDLSAFNNAHLRSSGDMRLLAGISGRDALQTDLLGGRSLDLTAAQIYPATRAKATINAGIRSLAGADPQYWDGADGILRIHRIDSVSPAAPHSVDGQLHLVAATIEQGGIVRAPFGRVQLGGTTMDERESSRVHLLPGSLTSTSGAGLALPHGGTVDGLRWELDGRAIDTTTSALRRGVTLVGSAITADDGAVLDLSAGGELTGAAHVSGRGGSVDIRQHALADANPAYGFSDSSNTVYAIVPGYDAGTAPAGMAHGTEDPMVGQRIVVPEGVPGLAAGTYTLLPASYALQKGAFRVELGAVESARQHGVVATGTGSWRLSAQQARGLGAQAGPLYTDAILTPADVVRRHSGYNEMGFNAFLSAASARNGIRQNGLTTLPGLLSLVFGRGAGLDAAPALSFNGTARWDSADGKQGARGDIAVRGHGTALEILADGQQARTTDGAAVQASALNALDPSAMTIGTGSREVTLRSGASLTARQVAFEVAAGGQGLTIEQGATISTIGRGGPVDDTVVAYTGTDGNASLVVSNDRLDMIAPRGDITVNMDIGACLSDDCSGQTLLLSEGTIGVATSGSFQLRDNVSYGTRRLALSMTSINMGTDAALGEAAANAALPPGLSLNQQVLQGLLRGNTALGTPALETLALSARDAINVYGSVDLDTRNAATGRSSLQQLVLGAPAVHGYGGADDRARIIADTVIWAGTRGRDGSLADATPEPIGAPMAGRLGSGSLDIIAETIEFGHAAGARLPSEALAHREVLGFSSLNLQASTALRFSGRGSLDVHQQRGDYVTGSGWQYSGGAVNITSPLVTGAASAVLDIRTGGDLTLAGGASSAGSSTAGRDALGAELGLKASTIRLDTDIALASGRLRAEAVESVLLGGGADLDLAGRKVTLADVDKYSWGGDVELTAAQGNVVADAGSRIDVSARNNRAGRISATALGADAGRVDLAGTLSGAASGRYDAGGSRVPYDSGELFVRAQQVQDFTSLNQRLDGGGLHGTRSFQIKQGDLVVGDALRARHVELSLDGGSLHVTGRIDASGEQVGSIRLHARDGVRVDGTLDAHGTQLRVDSYGRIIESPNRAIVELGSAAGTVSLGSTAHIDLRSGTEVATGTAAGQNDGRARGTLKLNVPRVGVDDAAFDGQTGLRIDGAADVQLNAFRRYDDAPLAATPDVTGHRPQEVTQGWMDGVDADSRAWMDAALGNAGLQQRRAALGTHRLRPGVEIVGVASDANPHGDLTVSGDIDLSGYRYGPDADRLDPARRGFGESAALVLRAEGDINVHGSINDGFAPPPVTPDDAGWVLGEAANNAGLPMTPMGADIVIPIDGVTLEAGTTFRAGVTLNYGIRFAQTSLPAGTVLPTGLMLAGELALPAGTVLSAGVMTADGQRLAAGSVLQQAVTLGAGTVLDAGFVLGAAARIEGGQWPAGVALPTDLSLSTPLALARGAVIPSMTDVQLAGDLPVNLRPVDADGRQGRNWAMAAMLPEGTTSWDLTAVAGADLDAADPRLRRYGSNGDIVLADTHFGAIGKVTLVGQRVLTLQASLEWSSDGSLAGKPVSAIIELYPWMTEDEFCSFSADYCVIASRTVTSEAASQWAGDPSLEGMSVPDFLSVYAPWITEDEFCSFSPDYCVDGATTPVVSHTPAAPAWSVLRTGTGDMELLAARDVRMMSAFGVYTAGTQTSFGDARDAAFQSERAPRPGGSALLGDIQSYGDHDAALAAWQAWYPDHGGNLRVSAGRDIRGDAWAATTEVGYLPPGPDGRSSDQFSADIGNWLWRQGTGSSAGADDTATSWWINFGAYSLKSGQPTATPRMVGFTGFGTLGGGNLTLDAGRDAGVRHRMGGVSYPTSIHSTALVAAVGSTGRVSDGVLHLTGGGDLAVRIGGALNPSLAATSTLSDANNQHSEVNGTLTNLRGHFQFTGARMGGIAIRPVDYVNPIFRGLRKEDEATAQAPQPMGGPVLVLGDAVAQLDARGDVVIAGVLDAGRVPVANYVQTRLDDGTSAAGTSWFSLWTSHTSVNLVSAGGDVTPGLQAGATSGLLGTALVAERATDYERYWLYPSQLRLLAASGSIRLRATSTSPGTERHVLLTAPGASGVLEALAMDSIFAPVSAPALSSSGADTLLPTPFSPAFVAEDWRGGGTVRVAGNTSSDGSLVGTNSSLPLFAFGPNAPRYNDARQGTDTVNQFIAATGDIIGLKTGQSHTQAARDDRTTLEWIDLAAPIRVVAGRDILASELRGLNNDTTDVSSVQAGRDIIHTQIGIAGPGNLEVSAGRHIRQENMASIISSGPLVQGDTRPGASISVTAGNQQLDYAALRSRYLDPANLADPALTLAEQPGKAVKLYGEELQAWLKERFGFSGEGDAALAFFDGLAGEQQRIFLREVYHAELRASGREYNSPDNPRFGSYLRGREAIATFAPDKDAQGAEIVREGDVTLFGASGVRTLGGGDIDVLSPGGQIVVGVQGEVPPASAGLVTQGQGDIRLFSEGSLLLGLSRIMTTYGGSIQGWSEEGDINAGRGAATSVLYTPPLRVYDQWGNVNLSPQAPATGAGIATLAPIAEVAAGDVDLIAPLGTIDAGEAGIRVSGNVNLAALQVLNAANIQVQGESTGMPVLATVNVNALASASAAANTASQAAQDVMRKTQDDARRNMPSEIRVQVLGFGAGSGEAAPQKDGDPVSSYDPESAFQFPQAGAKPSTERR